MKDLNQIFPLFKKKLYQKDNFIYKEGDKITDIFFI